MKNVSILNVRIPDRLRSELEKIARQEDRSVSDIVRDSLRRYISARRFRSLRSRTLPFAEAQGYVFDDDVFKAIS